METLVPLPALVALVPVVLPVIPVALAPVVVVALAPVVVVALAPVVVVALAPVVVVALAPVVVVALAPVVVVALAPVVIFLKDGGTSSISGLNFGSGGNPYCLRSDSCCCCIICVEKVGPLYPNSIHNRITTANEMPITSMPNATPRICGE